MRTTTLYSELARGMPPPPKTATNFQEILEQIWWRLDAALDLEMLEWSAKLGALEALESGTTAIIDHNETPNAIEGSLSVIADACAEVGVRVVPAYGITDRHGADGAARGLEENRGSCPRGATASSVSTLHSRARTTAFRQPQISPTSSMSACTSTWPRAWRQAMRHGDWQA